MTTLILGRIQVLTSHPMLLTTKLRAFGHLLANRTLADLILFGSFLVWAVADRISMKHRVQRKMPRLPGGIVAVLLCVACTSGAQAENYRYGYPYRHHYPYDNYEFHDKYRLRQDMNRLREQMQRQQKQLKEQVRLQQEQTRLLRQGQSAQHQATAMQACYYRFNAGLDLCEDLFDAASAEYAACRAKVVEKNPGCAGDIARPAFSSGD